MTFEKFVSPLKLPPKVKKLLNQTVNLGGGGEDTQRLCSNSGFYAQMPSSYENHWPMSNYSSPTQDRDKWMRING